MGRPPSVPPPPHNRQADRSAVESSPLPLPPGLVGLFCLPSCCVLLAKGRPVGPPPPPGMVSSCSVSCFVLLWLRYTPAAPPPPALFCCPKRNDLKQ